MCQSNQNLLSQNVANFLQVRIKIVISSFELRVRIFQNGGLQMIPKPNYSTQAKGWAEEQAGLRSKPS